LPVSVISGGVLLQRLKEGAVSAEWHQYCVVG
jgi:hypothetical protein